MRTLHPQSLHRLHDIIERYELTIGEEATLRQLLGGRQVVVFPETHFWYRWEDLKAALEEIAGIA